MFARTSGPMTAFGQIPLKISLTIGQHELVLLALRSLHITMKIKLFTAVFGLLAWTLNVTAQDLEQGPTLPSRNAIDPTTAPFYHGIASGDPLPTAVIIWTRLTVDNPQGTLSVNWRMATDTALTSVVASGTATTDGSRDYTVKVDVTGLQPNTWYYYDFNYNGTHSLKGRTRTAPTGNQPNLRFAVVSCSSYEHGYFNAYSDLSQRNDFDAVLHLGDYIYEYAVGGYSAGLADRTFEPTNEIITLSDYRTRYSHYRLDPDLRAVHRQYPFINIWDDHETANDSWSGGAQNHTEGAEGAWVDRKAAAIQAHEEWLPIRKPDPTNPERIYRNFTFGNLADLIMLDTRLYARDEQGSGAANNRSMLGYEQRHWLYDNLSNSTATWKVIGQQVMMAPLTLFGIPVNNDQWDGYPAERDSLFNHISTNGINNSVVLTGDIHTAWANDLPLSGYVAATGANSAGVEFVGTSVTSPGLPIGAGASLIQSVNPHIKYVNLADKGYFILDLTAEKAQADYYKLSTVTSTDFTTAWDGGRYTLAGENHISQATTATTGSGYPVLAPLPGSPSGVIKPTAPVIVSVAPNPFIDRFVIQLAVILQGDITLTLTDLSGKAVSKTVLQNVPNGIQYIEFDGEQLPAGTYVLQVTSKSGKSTHRVVRSR